MELNGVEKSNDVFQTDPSLRLMERVIQTLSHYRYSPITRSSYCRWIKEYVVFLGKRQVPANRFQKEINAFLEFLSKERSLSTSSRKQALNAIAFLYKRVFLIEINVDIEPVKVRRETELPVVMTPEEVNGLLSALNKKNRLMASLLYGSGLRLMECLRLRVHHLDFKRNLIYVYPVKGRKRRVLMMPKKIREALIDQVEDVRIIHRGDLQAGYGAAEFPRGMDDTYKETEKDFVWQYVFPAKRLRRDNRSGRMIRFHVMESGLQKAVKTAALRSGIKKNVSCMTLRHSFAVHLLENKTDIFQVKDLMGHTDINQTRVYTRVIEKKYPGMTSPLDLL